MSEGQQLDYKSLRVVTGKKPAWSELARDCVAFANASGGRLHIGIEDDATRPPVDQRIDPTLLDQIRKRIKELTVNVEVLPELIADAHTGGEFIALTIRRATGVASTSEGRYMIRVGDECRPVTGDDVLRLINDRPSTPWETMASLGQEEADPTQIKRLCMGLRESKRVKQHVREKPDGELLTHYGLVADGVLTNLGVLLIGTPRARARLGSFPIIQAIEYDEHDAKVGKQVWDEGLLSPVDLVAEIWDSSPAFRQSYEIPEGLYRTQLPAFEQAVVREVLVNALVHRPYTQRGDIFVKLYPNRLEVVNPGRLPIGVTPSNILHTSRRRNDGLSRVFHDLGLMENEGSGFDLIYDRLLTSGRPTPTVREGVDSVHVVVPRKVIAPAMVQFLAEVGTRHELNQRERITLGLVGQADGLSTTELSQRLELPSTMDLEGWLGSLPKLGLVATSGRTRSTRYFVPPELLRRAGLDEQTTLVRIEPHRLRELILEDLRRYPDSGRADIHRRIGDDIPIAKLRRALATLVTDGAITFSGEKRWRTYRHS